MQSAQGAASQGGQTVSTSGLASTTKVLQSYPLCMVTVNIHGGGLATIYSDNSSTPLANPFIASSTGYWDFYAANGRYDVTLSDNSGSGPAAPVLISDILLDDPAAVSVVSVFGRTGVVAATSGDYDVAKVTGAAPLASPVLSGVPTAPTATSGTSTDQIATCAFVSNAFGPLAPDVNSVFGRTGLITGQTGDYSVGQVTGAAPLASPTLTGTPSAPTAAPGTNTTQVASTAFVADALASATSPVASVFGRTGAVVAQAGDYAVADVTGAAPLANPTFTGDPKAPTPSLGDNDTSIATTAFVKGQGYLDSLTSLNLITPQIGTVGTALNAIITALGVTPNSAYTSIAAQSGQEQTFTVTGAAVTGIAMVSPKSNLGDANLVWVAWVSAADTVIVRIINPALLASTPSAVNWNVVVIQ